MCECGEQAERMRRARPSHGGWCKMWTILEVHEREASARYAGYMGQRQTSQAGIAGRSCHAGYQGAHGMWAGTVFEGQ